MWNKIVYFNNYNYCIVQNIINCLKEAKFKGVKYYYVNNELHVENSQDISRFSAFFMRLVARECTMYYKQMFFNKRLNIVGKYKDVLNKLLVLFELDVDSNFVYSRLNPKKNIVVHSYYMFMCKVLFSKWENLASLVSINNGYLSNSDVAIEFFSYLLDNIDVKNRVSLNMKNNNYLVGFNSNEILFDSEEDVLIELIKLTPNSIDVYCSESMSEKLLATMYKLFNQKINLLV